MFKFVLQVLVSSVVLAAAVLLGLPHLKEKNPVAYGKIAAIFNAKAAAPIVPVASSAMPTRIADAADTPLAKAVATADNIIAKTTEIATQVKEAVVESVVPATTSITSTASTMTNSTPTTEEDDPLSALNKDPGYDWGIVVTNSFFYGDDMKKKGVFAGGTVVSSAETVTKKDGIMHRVYYLDGRTWQYQTVLVYEHDLAMFRGRYDETNKEQRDIIVEYCKLYGQLEEMRTKLVESVKAKNPHAAAYRTASAERRAFYDKAGAMRAEMETASGSRRGDLLDSLRRMKAEESSLNKRFNEAQKHYEEWNMRNVTPGLKTIDMQRIENRMKTLHPRANEIVPGI